MCPACQRPLNYEDDSAIWVGPSLEEGFLRCTSCATRYPVRRGIPRFVDDSLQGSSDVQAQTAKHFHHEFTTVSEGDRDVDSADVVEYYFLTRTGIDPRVYDVFKGEFFLTELGPEATDYEPDYKLIRDQVVLDAGCGPGRFTRTVASEAELVVGLDIGEHIDRAAASCADLENVEFVQGSVLAPPFRAGAFGFVFSVGVLHHTPDPKGGVKAIANLVAPDGHLSVWVYPPEYWNGFIRGLTGRAIHAFVTRLGPGRAWQFCARVLYPLGRLQMRIAKRRWTKLLFAPLFAISVPRHPRREVMIGTIYDYYGPRIITTHRYPEVESWFRDAGLVDLERVPLPTAWLGRKPA